MKSVKYNKNLNKMLKTSIVTFSVLTIINCVGIIGSSNALFEKSIDSKNNLSINVANPLYAKSGVATNKITDLSKIDKTNLVYDETADNNLRYIGKDPNNYFKFNNELWRIIGIFNNQLKLMRQDGINVNAWDTNKTNNWSTSSLNEYLNSTYLNNFESSSKNLISNGTWHMGGLADVGKTSDLLYDEEKKSSWTGKIGLISVSEYGYGSSSCSKKIKLSEYKDCINDNWLNTAECYWTITSKTDSERNIWRIGWDGVVNSGYVSERENVNNVIPSLYLKPSVKITGGMGTAGMPYTLSL